MKGLTITCNTSCKGGIVEIMQQEINPQSVLQDKTEKGMHMLKSFPKKFGSKSTLYLILGSIAVVLLGVATGWFF